MAAGNAALQAEVWALEDAIQELDDHNAQLE